LFKRRKEWPNKRPIQKTPNKGEEKGKKQKKQNRQAQKLLGSSS